MADVDADKVIAALPQFQFKGSVCFLRFDELFAVHVHIPNITTTAFSAFEDSAIRRADERVFGAERNIEWSASAELICRDFDLHSD